MDSMVPFEAPVVDELTIRVLVDSRHERFLPKAMHPMVGIEHLGRIPGSELSTFAAEWGLSLHLSSSIAGAKAQYVLDFGYTPEILNRNFDLLDIDQVSLRAHRVDTVCCPKPLALEGPFTSGYIERNSFEQVTGGTLVQDDHYTEAERGGKLVRDQNEDEHATCYIVKGRGLVVISSCGHTGIINTVRGAMAAANVDKVHAVVGGFHLGMAPLPYLQSTLQEMEAINPDVIVPMHCTGTAFIEMLRERMPEKLVHSNVGSRFTFGA